jgi:hypothetical protein
VQEHEQRALRGARFAPRYGGDGVERAPHEARVHREVLLVGAVHVGPGEDAFGDQQADDAEHDHDREHP